MENKDSQASQMQNPHDGNGSHVSPMRQKKRFRSNNGGYSNRSEPSQPAFHDENTMRRKSNNNGGHHTSSNKNNNGQMARRRFRPEQNTGKIKNVAASRDKYLNLAREAMAQGDRIEAENYLQHADHYFRVLSTLQEEDARNRPERQEPAVPQDAAGPQDVTGAQESVMDNQEEGESVPFAAAM